MHRQAAQPHLEDGGIYRMRWWGRGDSNSHAFRHMILSHARLPIPTLPHSIWGRLYPCELAGVERIGVRDRVFRLLDMVRMKRCQWDARVELVCINLGELAAPGAKKFWKTCTFRTFCTRQSWERIGPALRDGALSGNHFCTQLAPYAPVCGVSGISWMPLNRRRP